MQLLSFITLALIAIASTASPLDVAEGEPSAAEIAERELVPVTEIVERAPIDWPRILGTNPGPEGEHGEISVRAETCPASTSLDTSPTSTGTP